MTEADASCCAGAALGADDTSGGATTRDGATTFAKAATDLEWPRLCEHLARKCVSEAGRGRLAALEPASTLVEARARAELATQALDALAEGRVLPVRAVPTIDDAVAHAERGGVPEGDELRLVASVLAAADDLRAFARLEEVARPELAAAISSNPALTSVRAEIERCLEPDGRVSDAASPALREARRRVERLQQRILAELGRLCTRYADVLREPFHVERDGRYGLPVRSDAHRSVPGIVLGASSTGVTLFVEPPEITRIGNERAIAASDVTREERRVLAELARSVGDQAAEVRTAIEACTRADVLAALAAFAVAARAFVVSPGDEPRVELERMRHPLLVLGGGEVVANDLALAAGQGLVVSGPNAGGKTVALKCLGLAVWMARAGVPVPAGRESRVGYFTEVLSDIGDAQSLERSLSTFSAHVENVGRILTRARQGTLVLLDEVAGGTDPDEGAALAVAVLEGLLARGAAVAVTTHHERLKELAAVDGRFMNAAVGFDFEHMQPTFRLAVGTPGASSALAVALRHRLPQQVVDRARELLSAPTRDRERLVRELEEERRRLAEARAAAEHELEHVSALRSEIDAERAAVRARERERLARVSADLLEDVKQARAALRAVEQGLRAGGSDARRAAELRVAERTIDEAARLVGVGGPLERARRGDEGGPGVRLAASALRAGARAHLPRLAADVQLLADPDRGEVEVKAGSFTVRVRVDELEPPRGPKPVPPRGGGGTRAGHQVAPDRDARTPDASERVLRTASATCDLRGQRADEALSTLDRFVDAAARAGEPFVFVLHGHGTGALRAAVREHVAVSERIATARPATIEEGGDAFTVAWIRR